MDILTPSLRISNILLRSQMTFCDQRSPQKVRFPPPPHFVYKTNRKVTFFIWACKSEMFPSFGCACHLFKLDIDPNEDLKQQK